MSWPTAPRCCFGVRGAWSSVRRGALRPAVQLAYLAIAWPRPRLVVLFRSRCTIPSMAACASPRAPRVSSGAHRFGILLGGARRCGLSSLAVLGALGGRLGGAPGGTRIAARRARRRSSDGRHRAHRAPARRRGDRMAGRSRPARLRASANGRRFIERSRQPARSLQGGATRPTFQLRAVVSLLGEDSFSGLARQRNPERRTLMYRPIEEPRALFLCLGIHPLTLSPCLRPWRAGAERLLHPFFFSFPLPQPIRH